MSYWSLSFHALENAFCVLPCQEEQRQLEVRVAKLEAENEALGEELLDQKETTSMFETLNNQAEGKLRIALQGLQMVKNEVDTA